MPTSRTLPTDPRRCFHSFPAFALLALGLAAGLAEVGFAGGGPENVLLVVNRNSPASLTVANHYIRFRQIPAGNVLTLPWTAGSARANVDSFRDKILVPVLTAIKNRRLAGQIDYVVYSADFPTGISLKSDVSKFLEATRKADQARAEKPAAPRKWPTHLTQVGSITGLTYLWQPVAARNPAYFDLTANCYTVPVTEQQDAPTLGFRSRRQFGPRGQVVESGGRTYLLSVMLGVTTDRGNSLGEILSYLRRSAAADGTHPKGTIYYVKNNGVRSKARHNGFPAAVEELGKLGVAAEILDGKIPLGKNDVQGAMVGTHVFSWKDSGSTILPGAICEHFTSFGGKFDGASTQTPLSEFLRYGAAGASGTVTEPYAIPMKFPRPMMHVHYARGCTLAEAFYQSVQGPYQLLIVGDPLCRPWANIPKVKVQGVEPGETVTGKISLKPSATVPGGSKVGRFELFVDGWRRGNCGPEGSLELDTAGLADGHHELRVVAIEAGNIESQGRRILSIATANHGRKIAATATPSPTVRVGQPLEIAANSPGSTQIAVLHNSRLIGKIDGESGRLKVNPATLGDGPVTLRVIGIGTGGPQHYAMAAPIELTVVRGRP